MKYYNIDEAAIRIRNARKKCRYTQEQVAEIVHVDRNSIGRIERGMMACSIDLFIQFADLYGVTLDYLIAGKTDDSDQLKAKLDAVIGQLNEIKREL